MNKKVLSFVEKDGEKHLLDGAKFKQDGAKFKQGLTFFWLRFLAPFIELKH